MDYSLLWKAFIVVLGGTLLLRIAGRKSISQMTLAQVVVMIGIGSLLVQPIVGSDVWATLAVGLVLVITLFMMEYGQIKFDFLEKLITGKSKVLIENGQLKEKSLKKLRLTVDQLEIQLRQNQISNISDVNYATLEANGQVCFILKEEKQSATKEDIQKLSMDIQQLKDMIVGNSPQETAQQTSNEQQNDLFKEVTNIKKHRPPKYLQ